MKEKNQKNILKEVVMRKIINLSCVAAMVILFTTNLFAISCKDAKVGLEKGVISINAKNSICNAEMVRVKRAKELYQRNILPKGMKRLQERVILLERKNQKIRLVINKAKKTANQFSASAYWGITFWLVIISILMIILIGFIYRYVDKKERAARLKNFYISPDWSE